MGFSGEAICDFQHFIVWTGNFPIKGCVRCQVPREGGKEWRGAKSLPTTLQRERSSIKLRRRKHTTKTTAKSDVDREKTTFVCECIIIHIVRETQTHAQCIIWFLQFVFFRMTGTYGKVNWKPDSHYVVRGMYSHTQPGQQRLCVFQLKWNATRIGFGIFAEPGLWFVYGGEPAYLPRQQTNHG